MRQVADEPERHAFCQNGCTDREFAVRFNLSDSGARHWLARNGYKQHLRDRRDNDTTHPTTLQHAYYALLASIITGWGSQKALRKVAG